MSSFSSSFIFICLSLLFVGAVVVTGQIPTDEILSYVQKTYYNTVYPQWTAHPRDYPDRGYPNETEWRTIPYTSAGFTLGDLSGQLWFLYDHTNDANIMKAAAATTLPISYQQNDTSTHDIGFIIMSSFGHAYRLTGNADYFTVIHRSAISLTTRYSPLVHCTRSWNSAAPGFEVIIDNMMNLELLWYVAAVTGNSTMYNMAWQHANRTQYEHLRDDGSTYHVVNYNENNGSVINKYTAQGWADWSCWSRGQAWGVYGFTVAYRFTNNPAFLHTAMRLAAYFADHLNQTDDHIVYWDFNAPYQTSYQPRDTSAASIFSSALIELSTYVPRDQAAIYLRLADDILANLISTDHHYYTANDPSVVLPGLLLNVTAGPFHGTTNSTTRPFDVAEQFVRQTY